MMVTFNIDLTGRTQGNTDDSHSIDIAIKKAKTACHFAMLSGEIGKLSLPSQPLYGIEHSNDGLITFLGGLPIVDNEGILVGAIGVSGDSVENDHIVAQAGVDVAGVCNMPNILGALSFKYTVLKCVRLNICLVSTISIGLHGIYY